MHNLPPAALKLGGIFREYLLPVFVGDFASDSQRIDDSGTAFLLRPANQAFLVTAAHVLRAAETVSNRTPGARILVSEYSMSLAQRLIDVNDDLDVATFHVTSDEAAALGTQPVALGRHGWPPPNPRVGDIAVLAGFPAQERFHDQDGNLDLGIYTAYLKVADVGPRHLSFVIDYHELEDYLGSGLPPDGYRLGGLSGGPVVVLEPGPILCWRLCGVMKQQSTMTVGDFVQAARADFITAAGHIATDGAA